MLGVYYPLPFEDPDLCRVALNTSKLKSLWCSIYDEETVDQAMEQFGGVKLPEGFARKLDYDSHAVSQAGGAAC
jgi:hypothetical protein